MKMRSNTLWLFLTGNCIREGITKYALELLCAYVVSMLFYSSFVHAQSPTPDRTAHSDWTTDEIDLGNGKRAVIFGVSNYRKYDGSFDAVNTNVYTRDERTADGFKYGVWANNIIAEFPDSSKGFVVLKLRDGSVVKQKFIGVAYLNRLTKEYTLLALPNIVPGIINNNEYTFSNLYNGVDLKYTIYDEVVKSELLVSESVRNNLASPYPLNQTLIVLITEMEFENLSPKSKRDLSDAFQTDNMIVDSVSIGLYKGTDEPLRLPFGWAFQESERSNPNQKSFRMKQAHIRKNGKNYALSGIPLNLVIDTINYPGTIVFDPTVIWQHGPSYGKDTFLDESEPEDNRGVRTDLFIQADAGLNRHMLLQFDSISTISSSELITDAQLILTVDPGGGTVPDSLTSIYRVTRLWTEGTETGLPGISSWDSISTSADNGGPSDSAWTSAGGDYNSTKYSTRTLSGYSPGDTVIYAGDLKDLVQGWVDRTWTNYGMLIKFDTKDWGAAAREEFVSSDGVSADRPKLIVTYHWNAIITNFETVNTSYDRFTAKWDTTLYESEFDSFAVYLSDFPGDTSSLQLYIPSNLNAGDSSGHGRDGTNNGALLISNLDSVLGGGVYTFDLGVNDYINFGDILDIGTGDMSITAIVTPYTVTRGFIVSKAQNEYQVGYTFGFSESGQIRASIKVGSGVRVTGSTPNAGQKYVYAATWDRDDSLKIYVDGQFDAGASITGETANSNTTRALRIGLNSLATFFPFHGTIDEVKIYKRVLTATEILNYYNEVSNPRHSTFTVDTTVILTKSLYPLTEYEFVVYGLETDTLEDFSNFITVTTDSFPKPDDISLYQTNYNNLVFSYYDTSGVDSLKLLFTDTLGFVSTDTITFNGTGSDSLFDTLNFAGIYDTLTYVNTRIIDKNDNVYLSDSLLTFYSMAQYVPAITVSDTSDSTIQIVFNTAQDSNPDRVFYQLWDSTWGVYIKSNGDTVYSETYWFAKSAFDTVDVTVPPNSEHILFVNSRNSDSLETGYLNYDSLYSWAQVPDMVSAFAHSKDSVLIVIDPRLNPSYTFFAIEDSVSELFVDFTNHTLRSPGVTADSTWAWATFSEWGASAGFYVIVEPNTTYVFRAYTKEGTIRDN